MSEKIEPALTTKEWQEAATRDGLAYATTAGELVVNTANEFAPVRNPHGLAALCLHGQPFGFTWEDVDALRERANSRDQWTSGLDRALHSIADRIAALLPPRT